jgi:hypothetical protein
MPENILAGHAKQAQARSAMMSLRYTVLLCVLGTAQATAQNVPSQELLVLSEDERNVAFTRLLQMSNEKCDRVVRTLFKGTALELDDWEALCSDRYSYSISIPPHLNAGIDLISCRDLLTTSKMLLHRAGSKSRAIGCRIR